MRSSRRAKQPIRPRQVTVQTAARRRSKPSTASELQERLRELNERILRWADDPDKPADLVCECVDPQCFAVVTVTPATYREVAFRGEWVVAPGHQARVRLPPLGVA